MWNYFFSHTSIWNPLESELKDRIETQFLISVFSCCQVTLEKQPVIGCLKVYSKHRTGFEHSFTKALTQEDFLHLCSLARTRDTSVKRLPPYFSALGGYFWTKGCLGAVLFYFFFSDSNSTLK